MRKFKKTVDFVVVVWPISPFQRVSKIQLRNILHRFSAAEGQILDMENNFLGQTKKPTKISYFKTFKIIFNVFLAGRACQLCTCRYQLCSDSDDNDDNNFLFSRILSNF